MKKSSKKLLSYTLSFCICSSALAGSINAESAKALSDDILSVSSDLVSKVSLFDVSSSDRLWAKYYTYEVTEDNEIMITGTVSDTKTDLIIPDYIDDMPVTVIGDKAFYSKGINSIQLPSNLKKIGNSAFKECSIASVDISKTMITEIGDSAFRGCKIGEITFPDTLETIGNYSFSNTNLKTVYVPDSVKSIGEGCFRNCYSLLYADTGNGITTINIELFRACYNIRQIHISDSTRKICDYAFCDCSELEIVNLPSSVEVLENSAFYVTSEFFTLSGYKEVYEKAYGSEPWMTFIEPLEKNEKVYESTSGEWEDYFQYFITAENKAVISGIISDEKSDIVVPESIDGYPVTRIASFAFANSSFKNITLPSTLKWIGVQSFEGSAIENISIPDGVEIIPYATFRESNLQSINFPKTGLKKIGDSAFNGCKIGEITFPDTLETIGNYSFSSTNLKTVYVPDSVKSIGEGCFRYCYSLLYADTGNGITTINIDLFRDCYNIRQIHISDSTRKICDYAFCNCSKLEIVNLPSSVEILENSAFYVISEIFTLSGYKEVYEKAYSYEPWKPFMSFIEPLKKNEKVYESTSNEWEDYYDYVITAENDVLILGAKNNSSRNIVIPESIEGRPVTAISAGAFYNTPVTSVEFPETLKRIGAYAFSKCSIASLKLPDSIEIIRTNSFEGNDALKKLTIPGNAAYIESDAFSNCTALEKITLDSGLTEINGNVFKNCTALKSVTVPETVTSIDDNAFSGCENLNTIYGKPETYAEEYAFINNYEFIDSDEIIDIEPEYSSGDINGDGSVSVPDMLLLKRYILLADTEINERADINKDGKINIFDFARLKNIILTI